VEPERLRWIICWKSAFKLSVKEIPVSLLQFGWDYWTGRYGNRQRHFGRDIKIAWGKGPDGINNLKLSGLRSSNLPPSSLLSYRISNPMNCAPTLPWKARQGILSNLIWTFPFCFPSLLCQCPFLKMEILKGGFQERLILKTSLHWQGSMTKSSPGPWYEFRSCGTLKSPKLEVMQRLKTGVYEYLNIGASVKNRQGRHYFDGSRFVFEQSYRRGRQGRHSYRNRIFWSSPSKDFPYDLSLNIKRVTIINTDTASLTVLGKASLSGTSKDHIIEGKLTVRRADFKIPERLPAEITALEVRKSMALCRRRRRKNLQKVSYEIWTVSGKRWTGLFDRQGLNSEWKGNIAIKGTTSEPIITGRLSIVRGSYNLESASLWQTVLLIWTVNTRCRRPLDVTGKAETNKITAIINITGDVSKPKITLTSEPSLPNDEILSQLLFGQEIAKISPLQAIELAKTLTQCLGRELWYSWKKRNQSLALINWL